MVWFSATRGSALLVVAQSKLSLIDAAVFLISVVELPYPAFEENQAQLRLRCFYGLWIDLTEFLTTMAVNLTFLLNSSGW